MKSPRSPYLVPNLVVALVVAAAGAGIGYAILDGDGPDEAAALDRAATERAWAAEVCGGVTTWRSEIRESVADVRDGIDIFDPTGSVDVARAAFDRARAATETLVADLRAAPVPDTPRGRALATAVDELLGHASAHLEEIALRVAAIGEVGIIDALGGPGLLDESSALVDDLRTDLDALRAPARELLDVLRAQDECDPLLELLRLDEPNQPGASGVSDASVD